MFVFSVKGFKFWCLILDLCRAVTFNTRFGLITTNLVSKSDCLPMPFSLSLLYDEHS